MIETKFAQVELTDWGCITWFVDGSSCPAQHHPLDPHYQEITRRLGYGARTVAYCQEHELAHLIVEEVLHGRPSRVLKGLAHQTPIPTAEAIYEEAMAQTLQRWARAGERPIIGGVDWDELKHRFLEVVGEEICAN